MAWSLRSSAGKEVRKLASQKHVQQEEMNETIVTDIWISLWLTRLVIVVALCLEVSMWPIWFLALAESERE